MDNLKEKIKNLNVLIIGDIILDKYYFTDVEKISPEAPIPIAKFNSERLALGGAANVAINCSKLGAKTYIIGQIGSDEEGQTIKKLFTQEKITFFPIITKEKTITKTRILSRSAQLLRLDFEKNVQISYKEIIKTVNKISNKIDLILISDYRKGMISVELLKAFKSKKKYISLDTKPGVFKDLKGVALLKPNFKEAAIMAKELGFKSNISNIDSNVESIGKYLKKKLKTNLLITRSEKGATYIGKSIIHNKTINSEITDVTGAGDTCMAIFSILDYLNLNKKDALEIMNAAAKITVSHLGTYSPTIDEIKNELYKEDLKNIIQFNNINSLVNQLKLEKKKIVFTNGCFDILHKGHIDLLNKAKKLGDILIVGVNSDASIRRLKGNSRPIIDEASRAFMLSNLKSVDYVVIFEQDTPIELIKQIKPHIHVKGGDYIIDKMPETKVIKSYGGKVILIDLKYTSSTTKIVNKIKNG